MMNDFNLTLKCGQRCPRSVAVGLRLVFVSIGQDLLRLAAVSHVSTSQTAANRGKTVAKIVRDQLRLSCGWSLSQLAKIYCGWPRLAMCRHHKPQPTAAKLSPRVFEISCG